VPSNVKVSSSWKTVSALYTRVGGSWKNVAEGYTKVGGAWKSFFTSVVPLTVDHLVIAGGGGGGGYIGNGGGGGAGGYRTSAGTSGGGASAESRVTVAVSTNYTITVGAGGTGMGSGQVATAGNGSNSVFSTITSTGGGGGGGYNGGLANAPRGANGGSGGGAWSWAAQGGVKGVGTANQGFDGGLPTVRPGDYAEITGGGGGAAAVGANGDASACGNGGAGVASSITGTSVTRAGGGGGGKPFSGSAAGSGGTGGGGNGGSNGSPNGVSGTVSTGSGGGGNGYTSTALNPQTPGNGGSGVVILSYPSAYDIRNGAGLSYTTSVVGSNKVTVFTAGTGNIQFASAVNSSFVLLETVTLTSAQASVEFANLNTKYGSTYQHLQIRMVGRTTRAVSEDGAPIMYFNSDTSSSYRSHYLVGTGSSVVSYDNGTNMGLGSYPGNSAGANQFLGSVIDILDPFETTKNKTIRVLAGLAGSFNSVRLNSAAWFSTSALTTITINANSGSWATGTRISIYGLKGS
jgi:hypothetical protein